MSSVSELAALVVDDLGISSESQSLEDVHVDQSVQSAVQAKEVVVVERNRLENGVHVESIRVKLPENIFFNIEKGNFSLELETYHMLLEFKDNRSRLTRRAMMLTRSSLFIPSFWLITSHLMSPSSLAVMFCMDSRSMLVDVPKFVSMHSILNKSILDRIEVKILTCLEKNCKLAQCTKRSGRERRSWTRS